MLKSWEPALIAVPFVGFLIFCQLLFFELSLADRFIHTLLTMLLGVSVYALRGVSKYHVLAFVSFILLVGLFKELTDPTFDHFDLLADFKGAVFAVLLVFAIPKRFFNFS